VKPLAALLLLPLAAGAASAAERPPAPPPPSLGILAGLFEFTDDTYREGELGAQYRLGYRWGVLQPFGGAMVTTAGAFHVYAGVSFDVPLGRRWLLRGSFAPGYYDKGASGKDLGLDLEFRSGVEIAWRLDGGWRLGIEFYHLSNGNLGAINPGDGSLLLTATVPLGKGARRRVKGPRPGSGSQQRARSF